jgi:hypothetical protein
VVLIRGVAAASAAALVLAACGSTGAGSSHSTRSTTAPAATTSAATTTVPATTTTTAPRQETTTTVVGPHGPPSRYPAAQADPPSLAAATPTARTVDLVQVLVTLETYRDWVWSHPTPADVARYEDPSDPSYKDELAFITRLAASHLHASPRPTTIVWARMTSAPNLIDVRDGLETFQGGAVEAVFDLRPVPLLTKTGRQSGPSWTPPASGLVAYRITFAQSSASRWRILTATIVHPPGGVKRLISG